MTDLALETPRWHTPPSTGSKLRDAAFVAEKLAEWNTKLAVLPLAGLGKELSHYTGGARLIVADTDPAVRAFWRCASVGRLAECSATAAEMWEDCLEAERDAGGDYVQRAWKRLSAAEPPPDHTQQTSEHAAWALAVFAGARNGGRRRNGRGEWNWPYAPKSSGIRDPGWLTRRLPGAEKLCTADAWCRGRILSVCEDFEEAFRAASIELLHGATSPDGFQPDEVAYLIDPPYGEEKHALFDGLWTGAKRDRLAALTRDAVEGGAKAIAWCDETDLDAFAPLAPGAELYLDGAWGGLAQFEPGVVVATITTSMTTGAAHATWEDVGSALVWVRGKTGSELLAADFEDVPVGLPLEGPLMPTGTEYEFLRNYRAAPRRVGEMEWRLRPARVHMKSGGQRKSGVEPNRSAAGGWLGVSR